MNVCSMCWAGKIDQPWRMKIGEVFDEYGQDVGYFPFLCFVNAPPGGSRVTIGLTSNQLRTTPPTVSSNCLQLSTAAVESAKEFKSHTHTTWLS